MDADILELGRGKRRRFNGESNGVRRLADEAEDDDDDSDDDSWQPRGGEPDGDDSASAASEEAAAFVAFACVAKQDVAGFRKALAEEPTILLMNDGLSRSLLHLVLLRCLPDMLTEMIACDRELFHRALTIPFVSVEGDEEDARRDSFPPLHLALSRAPFARSSADSTKCIELLLQRNVAIIDSVDGLGRTALHIACLQGSQQAARTLLDHKADPNVQDDLGNVAVHYAIDSGDRTCVELLLRATSTSSFQERQHPLYRCIDCQAWTAALLVYNMKWPLSETIAQQLSDYAAARGLAKEWQAVSEQGAELSGELASRLGDGLPVFSSSTLLVTSSSCLEHGALLPEIEHPRERWDEIRRVPENPHRLEVVCGEYGVLRSPAFQDVRWIADVTPAPLVDLLRVHEYTYISRLEKLSQEVCAKGDPSAKTPVDKGDTKITRHSWEAARRACGCVLEAVNHVCNDNVRNAFCVVRPPGHHAGPSGTCDSDHHEDTEGSQGFCLLNNVAVGAAYARCVFRHVIHKVAIVDIDVHHGNGTEAIVRNVQARKKWRVEWSDISCGGFSAKICATPPPTCMPWLDRDTDPHSVFFASMHGYGEGFYPRSGSSCNETAPNIINVTLQAGSGSAEFRDGLRSRILPALVAFDPDIVFVSAGFDGHEGDLLGVCGCVDEDYAWATRQLLAVANRCCSGRLISVLEGGYNTRAESLSPFAQSVASHVRALLHTSPRCTQLDSEDGTDHAAADKLRCARRAAARSKRREKEASSDVEKAAFDDVFGSDADTDDPTVAANELRGTIGAAEVDASNGKFEVADVEQKKTNVEVIEVIDFE